MESYILEKDIRAFYITADSFPEGILPAHQKLHALVPFSLERKYFGISFPDETGKISYKASAEELYESESAKYNLPVFVIKKGNYTSIVLRNYREDITSISKAFDQLLHNPDIDPKGACVEWYINENDMRCMVRLKS